jgi:hypothetical protein
MPDMHPREERRARNENLFRDVNERIAAIQQTLVVAHYTEFVCECDDLACAERFEIRLRAYEQVREDPTAFVVVPGHEDPAVEDVIDERDGYNVVRKHPGEPARIAVEDAPR